MDDYNVRKLARILACQARVLGMQAENAWRESCGNSIAYTEEQFFAEAEMLENLARE